MQAGGKGMKLEISQVNTVYLEKYERESEAEAEEAEEIPVDGDCESSIRLSVTQMFWATRLPVTLIIMLCLCSESDLGQRR